MRLAVVIAILATGVIAAGAVVFVSRNESGGGNPGVRVGAFRGSEVLSALDSGNANTHSASVRIYDRTGEWVSTLHAGVDLRPANLAYDIVAAEGRPTR